MYFYGLFVAGFLIAGTVLLAMGINRAREWRDSRARRRPGGDPASAGPAAHRKGP